MTDAVLRMGIVGLGMAGAGMVSAILSHPRMLLAGAADPNAELRSRFERDHQMEVNADAAELLARGDIDAVYIATPHQFHRAHAVLAAEQGKHAIVEKPMALELADCDAMIAAAVRGGTVLIVGHTHGYDPAIALMRKLIAGGEYGRLAMLSLWNYTDFLYRPRRPEELDTSKGGGILFNQIPHQVDTARLLAGAPVRSVRAMTGVFDPQRPTEGACTAFLDFESGAVATLVYSGYDHFDSDELHGWIGEGGQQKKPNHGATRRALRALGGGEAERRARWEHHGYGSGATPGAQSAAPASQLTASAAQPRLHQPHFGVLIASCERADLRPSADGVLVYGDDGARELPVKPSHGRPGRSEVLDELYEAAVKGVRPVHDGAFAKGTLAACLAIQRSARERREVVL